MVPGAEWRELAEAVVGLLDVVLRELWKVKVLLASL